MRLANAPNFCQVSQGSTKRVAGFRAAVNRRFAELLSEERSLRLFRELKVDLKRRKYRSLADDAKLSIICGVCFAGRW
jgi:hypothetical protein